MRYLIVCSSTSTFASGPCAFFSIVPMILPCKLLDPAHVLFQRFCLPVMLLSSWAFPAHFLDVCFFVLLWHDLQTLSALSFIVHLLFLFFQYVQSPSIIRVCLHLHSQCLKCRPFFSLSDEMWYVLGFCFILVFSLLGFFWMTSGMTWLDIGLLRTATIRSLCNCEKKTSVREDKIDPPIHTESGQPP